MAKQSGMTRTINMLKEQGFVVPAGQERARAVRSDADILRRLMAVKATALWVTAPEERVPSHVADALGHVDAAARAGGEAVPGWFHPAIHGRVVWERCAALAWALSPGATWDQVYVGSNAGR